MAGSKDPAVFVLGGVWLRCRSDCYPLRPGGLVIITDLTQEASASLATVVDVDCHI